MHPQPHVFDVTTEGFEAEVIQQSMQRPVLIDFWATWCGPCQTLGPLLEKLAAEYNGAFVLGKVDVDKEQQVGAAFQIRSVPTVFLMYQGQIIDGFPGVIPENQLREFLTRNNITPLPQTSEDLGEVAAVELTPAEQVAAARAAVAAEPDKDELKLDLALALMQAGQSDAAETELNALPANLATDARAVRLRSQLELASTLKNAPTLAELQQRVQTDATDWEARDLLGVRLLIEDEPAAGLEQFLTVLEKARDWNDGAAKKRLIAAFATLDDAELVGRYRRRMASLLF